MNTYNFTETPEMDNTSETAFKVMFFKQSVKHNKAIELLSEETLMTLSNRNSLLMSKTSHTCTEQEREAFEMDICSVLSESVTKEYAQTLLDSTSEDGSTTLMDDIIEEIMLTSAWDEEHSYSASDIRLAIGRMIMMRLGIAF